MISYCLDTSAYTRFRLGDPQVVSLIDTAWSVAVPAIVIGELIGGFRLGTRTRENEMHLWDFLADPAADVIDADVRVAQQCADIYADLRQNGTPIPTNDMWVAATAAADGLTVLTYDDHFEAVSRVGSVVLPAT